MSIRSLVISKLAPKIRAETAWADVTTAVGGATAVQKASLRIMDFLLEREQLSVRDNSGGGARAYPRDSQAIFVFFKA